MGSVQSEFGRAVQRQRQKLGKSHEELARASGLHRTAIGKIERGERDPSLASSVAIAKGLGVPIQDLLYPRPIRLASGKLADSFSDFHVDQIMIKFSIEETYSMLDLIDDELEKRSVAKISELVELANLSSMVGNIFGEALAKASNGYWKRNGPHKYPDLVRTNGSPKDGVEVKVALETNIPKGHLPKPGPHISVRYVLVDSKHGYAYKPGERGDTVAVWEVKCGHLEKDDFRTSNTPGDSGKTANFSTEGFRRMKLVYFDDKLCPHPDVKDYLKKHGPI